MSRPLVLLLERNHVYILREKSDEIVVAWTPSAPLSALEALRSNIDGPSRLTLVVGMGLLEVARPELPPMPMSDVLDILLRDSDRYFPISDALALSCVDGFAFGIPAARLREWIVAFAPLGSTSAVATVAGCLVSAGEDNDWVVPADENNEAHISIRDATLRAVSLQPLPPDRAALSSEGVSSRRAILRGALELSSAPLPQMLLDISLRHQIAATRRMRWSYSVLALCFALAAFGFSVNRWRAREVAATDSALEQLDAMAEPARQADKRLQTARRELALLSSGSQDVTASVLSRLGQVLPADAFVQRLEWNGDTWQISGSADNAPRLVPLMDADSMFTDVRILAASSRFMDAGKQRESFSISFKTRAHATSR